MRAQKMYQTHTNTGHSSATDAANKQCVDATDCLLDVKNLSISFKTQRGDVQAVSNVSFKLQQSEILGVVGESGCGKSTLCSALVNNLPANVHVSGKICFKGTNILDLTVEQLKQLRGREITTVLQNPMTAMDPLFTVGNQIDEIIAENSKLTKTERSKLAIGMLTRVAIPSPKERLHIN